jgi:hypothetical protein
MQKRYSKPHEKDLLEEILNRNRKMLTKRALRNSSRTKKTRDRTNKSSNTGAVNTIFKSIGHRKNSDSLDSALRYVLKNTDTLENEMGETLHNDNINQEISRFDLIPDELNLKDPSKPISEDNLKSRQMWHCMFSLPNNESDIEDFKSAIREVMAEEFVGHKYDFGIHNDTNNMHAHIIVKEKNDLTNRKLRVGTRNLYDLNRKLQDSCINHGIAMDRSQTNLVEYDIDERIAKPKKKKQKKALPQFYFKAVRKWADMYHQDSFPQLETNKSTTDRLKKLGMDDEHINMFLNLYRENKSLATGAINENSGLFNIKKPKEKFNLRRMEVYEKGTMETMNSNSKSKHSKGVER